MKPQVIGQRYRLKSLIGEGGMASVYAAVDEKLDREVAIKVMHQHLARNSDIRERFLLEARTVSTLDHPNILRVYDFSGLDAEQLWIVTEILHGVDLAEYVRRFPEYRLHPLVSALIVREICQALNEVHKLKIVHRDIKPENIMVLQTGQVKLMDFGIAKVSRANATQTGTFMGSPSYMSPEQIRGAEIDFRADIYSLCVLFYEIVTGSLPYFGQTTAEVINRIMLGRYTPPEHLLPELPSFLSGIITKGLQNAKEDRFKDVQELSRELDTFIRESGFGESRLELERFVLHRKSFEKRLSELVPYLNRIKPAPGPTVQTPPLAQATLHQSDTELFETRRPEGGGTFAGPQAPRSTALGSPTGQTQSKGQDTQRLTRSPSVVKAEGSSAWKSTIQLTRPVRKIFIKEHVSGEQVRREPSSALYIALLVAAIGIVFMIGGDRLMVRLKRDGSRISQQLDGAGKKRVADETPPSPPPKDPIEEHRPSESEAGPLIVESQTVTIDSRNPPKVGRKETSSPRTGRQAAGRGSAAKGDIPLPAPTGRRSLAMNNPTEGQTLPISRDRTATFGDSLPQEGGVRDRGTLKIASLPAAEILIDGKLFGTTNDKDISAGGIKLDPGNYQLRLRRRGYRAEEQTVAIRSGETKQLSVSLNKSIELVELTVRTNRLPAQVLIEDVKSESRRLELTLQRRSKVFSLKPGQYRVQISYGREQINRVVELQDESRTFNADFK